MISPPAKLTWSQWDMLVNQPHMTLLRILEYNCVRRICLEGLALDIGGGRNSDYYRLLPTQGTVHAVNLDRRIVPTYIADLNQSLPVARESYDSVISLNTLEHVRRDSFVLEEMFRVLKPEGNLYVLVPFLYRVHASPSDYHRHTAHFWAETLMSIGFSAANVTIEPLTPGLLMASLALIEFSFPSWIRRLLRAGAFFTTQLVAMLRPGRSINDGRDVPLGYWISAHK